MRIVSVYISESDKVEAFLKKHGIKGEAEELGSGEFGTAYLVNRDTVVKVTSSKSEFDFAAQIQKNPSPYLVKIHRTEEFMGEMFIVQELLDQDGVEDLYYQTMGVVENAGYSIADLGGIDNEDLEEQAGETLSEAQEAFADELYGIYAAQLGYGVQRPDIQPDNLGYDKKGDLKAFDVDSAR